MPEHLGSDRSQLRSIAQLGFWSAAVVAAAALAFSVAAMMVQTHILHAPWDAVFSLVPSMVLAPSFLTLLVTVHSAARVEQRVWTRLAVAFACTYVPLVLSAYAVELFVVQPLVMSGHADRVSMLTLANGGRGGSILNTIDGLGYVLMSVACLFAAPVFRHGRLERVTRWMFLANGSLVVPIALTYWVSPAFIWVAAPWGITLPALGILLAIHFRRHYAVKVEEKTPGRGRRLRPWPAALSLLAILCAVYAFGLHPWLMSWGATRGEAAAVLPGDEVVQGPYFTRAISVDVPPSAVWPWIVQMGQDRAGFYSNDWLENLFTADIHNADVIHPEWQDRAIGDRVPLARASLVALASKLSSADARVEVIALEQERMIANLPGRFVLEPVGDHGTRLLVRESLSSQGPAVMRWLVWDPMHFVMVQRMLRGIKERAEGRPLVPRALGVAAQIGWLVAAVGLLGALLARRKRWRWLAFSFAAAMPPLVATGDLFAALAGFVAVGVTVGGALTLGRRWWPYFMLTAAGVLWILLLAPDAFVAIGLAFLAAAMLSALVVAVRARSHSTGDAPAARGPRFAS